MARIRSIKPEFWSDEKLGPCDPLTRLVFLGLISQADDAGRLFDSVKTLDGLLFPYTEDSCAKSLNKLAALGRIIRYADSSGRRLMQIVGWSVHQHVKNPSVYVLPGPSPEDWGRVGGESPPPFPVVGSPIPEVGSGAPDGAASERKAKRKAALPSDWKPNEGHHSRAKRDGLNVELECEKFTAYHTAKGSVMASWDAAFTTWLMNAVKFQARDSKRPSEDAAQALLARQADGWQERKRATEEAIARDLAKRTTAPPIANEPSGNLGVSLTRVLATVQPTEAA